MQVRYALVELARLRSHEEVQPGLLAKLVDQIRRDGFVRKPVLVESRHYVILDGHHRYEALRELGCRRVPCYLIDYFSDLVQLDTWPGAIVQEVTKEDVLRRGMRGDLLPPKTTRHTVRAPLPEVVTDLEDLL